MRVWSFLQQTLCRVLLQENNSKSLQMYVWSSNEIMSATIFLDLPHIAKGILWLLQIVRKICCMCYAKGEKSWEWSWTLLLVCATTLLFFLRCIPWKLLILICTSLSRSSVVVYWSVCGIAAVEMDRILFIISYILQYITYFVKKLIYFFQTFAPWKKLHK